MLHDISIPSVSTENQGLTDLFLDSFELEIVPMKPSTGSFLPVKSSELLHRPGITIIGTTIFLRVLLGDQLPKVFVLVSSLFEIPDELWDFARNHGRDREAGRVESSILGERDIGKYLTINLSSKPRRYPAYHNMSITPNTPKLVLIPTAS